MSVRHVVLWTVLIAFSTYSTWAMWDVGYLGIWEAGLQSKASLQILLDLVITCSLAGLWLIGDARVRQVRAWPWLAGILLTGSIGLLAYLIARELASSRSVRANPSAA